MEQTTGNSDEDHIGDIARKILMAWNDGLSLRQISELVGLAIEIVNRSLKGSLKAIIEHGVKRYAQKNLS